MSILMWTVPVAVRGVPADHVASQVTAVSAVSVVNVASAHPGEEAVGAGSIVQWIETSVLCHALQSAGVQVADTVLAEALADPQPKKTAATTTRRKLNPNRVSTPFRVSLGSFCGLAFARQAQPVTRTLPRTFGPSPTGRVAEWLAEVGDGARTS
jgi:hypothetical protein